MFFLIDTAPTEIYTLSLHDALPICTRPRRRRARLPGAGGRRRATAHAPRSEEHTSELQSRVDLVCRLLLEKKKRSSSTRVTIRRGRGINPWRGSSSTTATTCRR